MAPTRSVSAAGPESLADHYPPDTGRKGHGGRRFEDLKDRHRGARVFVLGDGPSLDDTPLHLLANEQTIGVDRIFSLFGRIRWRPTIYTVADGSIVASSASEINSLSGIQLCFPERFRGTLRDGDDVTWYGGGPNADPEAARLATHDSAEVRDDGSSICAAIELALHLGFDPIYLIGYDASLTVIQDGDGEMTVERLQQYREVAEQAGRRIIDATVGGELDVFESAPIRSLFDRKPPPRRAAPDPEPGALQGLLVPRRAHVAPTVLVAAVLEREQPGLVLDIGAGTGGGLAPFAAAGWEVRAFEPDPSTHDELVAAIPPQWPVFVDPRAVGGVETAAEVFVNPFGGSSLVPEGGLAEPSATVTVVTPATAMTTLGGRRPNIVLISAAGGEHEILRAYPFDVAPPDALVVDVDDGYTPRLGFRSCDLARMLEQQGYDVFALAHLRVGPTEATQIVCDVHEPAGELTHLIALPPGVATAPALELCRRAVLAARLEADAKGLIRRGTLAPARPSAQNDDANLRAQLDAVHASASWRVGHGIVLAAKRLVRPARRDAAAPRRVTRRLWARIGGS